MKFETIQVALLEEDDEKHLLALTEIFDELTTWDKDEIERATKEYCTRIGADYKNVAQLLQVALTARRYHIGYKSVVYILGPDEVKARIITLIDPPKKNKTT